MKWLTLIAIFVVTMIGSLRFADPSSKIPIYRKATYYLPEQLNLLGNLSTAESAIAALMYNGLFKMTEGHVLSNDLVEKWELDEKGLEYIFHLHKNIEFHNGKRLRAIHARDLLENLRSEKSPVAKMFERISSIEILNESTLKVRLDKPFPPFVSLLSGSFAKVTLKNQDSYPYGTGTFMFQAFGQYKGKTTLGLKAFDRYFGHKPKIDRIDLVKIDENEAIPALESGLVHDTILIHMKTPENLSSKISKMIKPSSGSWFLALNNASSPTNDKEFRRCLRDSLDIDKIMKKYYPHHLPALGFIPPFLLGAEGVKASEVKKICTHLQEKLVFDYPNVLENSNALCDEFSAAWFKMGISTQCRGLEFEDLLTNLKNKSAHVSFLGQSLDLPDVEYFIGTFESKSSFNYSHYQSREFDTLIEKSRETQDRASRAEIFRSMDQRLYDDVVTINLSYPPHTYLFHSCLEGLDVGLISEAYFDYSLVRLKKDCPWKSDFEFDGHSK